eukprot:7379754-Prymnesium_polylepis.2
MYPLRLEDAISGGCCTTPAPDSAKPILSLYTARACFSSITKEPSRSSNPGVNTGVVLPAQLPRGAPATRNTDAPALLAVSVGSAKRGAITGPRMVTRTASLITASTDCSLLYNRSGTR